MKSKSRTKIKKYFIYFFKKNLFKKLMQHLTPIIHQGLQDQQNRTAFLKGYIQNSKASEATKKEALKAVEANASFQQILEIIKKDTASQVVCE
jgi:hypothetical protein